ncbi:MAG: hypothetical protein A3F91_09295 [Flavobacteria bacterium RIFCSPLOWO2_12_FULL_35_11]|nr:MAG: hypothetical protein A3F91_09295 [Flavobacteria bacterium RIFCSPLOWO2_12_FULL_35_11]
MRNRSRHGFTLLEISLVLVIMGILSLNISKWVAKTADDTMVKDEYLKAFQFETGIKNSFLAILDTFEGVCGNIPSVATASFAWGYGSPSCQNTSPLPVVSGSDIVYNINLGSLSASDATGLKNRISSAYAPMCSISSSTATSLTLYCGGSFENLQYDTESGLVNEYHTPGGNFNIIDTPVPVLTLKRRYSEGALQESKVYRLNIVDVLQQRAAYTTTKFENIGRTLKTIYNTKLALETANKSPDGLNSIDDELIPWFWESFSDDSAIASTAICSKNSITGVCDNLNTNNIWRSNAGDSLLWYNLVIGQLSGDFKYSVDGFGNALRIIPIIAQCAASNLSLCSPTPPSLPAEPYTTSAIQTPPYSTLIYSNVSSGGVDCADTSLSAPAGCRYLVVY